MEIDNLTLGDLKAIRGLVGAPAAAGAACCTNYGIQIVVLDRGFVYVGKTRIEGDFVVIEPARCIRFWGTSQGLAELKDGPLSGTKLDPVIGTVRAPLRALISLVAVDEAKWKAQF